MEFDEGIDEPLGLQKNLILGIWNLQRNDEIPLNLVKEESFDLVAKELDGAD